MIVAVPEAEAPRADKVAMDPMPEANAGQAVQVPDAAEVCIGWRSWEVRPDDIAPGEIPILRSVTHTAEWIPGEPMEATCGTTDGDHVPGEQCSCGLYAARDLKHLVSMHYHTYDGSRGGFYCVVGPVSLWGKVIPGTQGWRAQFGYPRELHVPYEAWSLAKPLREAYGVPVHLRNILSY